MNAYLQNNAHIMSLFIIGCLILGVVIVFATIGMTAKWMNQRALKRKSLDYSDGLNEVLEDIY